MQIFSSLLESPLLSHIRHPTPTLNGDPRTTKRKSCHLFANLLLLRNCIVLTYPPFFTVGPSLCCLLHYSNCSCSVCQPCHVVKLRLRHLPAPICPHFTYPTSSLTMIMNWHRQKTADGNPLSPAHKVSFSDSSKSSEKRNSGRPSSRPSSSSNSRAGDSRTESPAPPRRKDSQQRLPSHSREKPWSSNRNTQLIDRQSEALWQ